MQRVRRRLFDSNPVAVRLPLHWRQVKSYTSSIMSTNNMFGPRWRPDHYTITRHHDVDPIPNCGSREEGRRSKPATAWSSTSPSCRAHPKAASACTSRSRSGCNQESDLRVEGAEEHPAEELRKPKRLVDTTVGRVIFNDVPPPRRSRLRPRAQFEVPCAPIAVAIRSSAAAAHLAARRHESIRFRIRAVPASASRRATFRTPKSKSRCTKNKDKEVDELRSGCGGDRDRAGRPTRRLTTGTKPAEDHPRL